jgi:pimeloyl-ACP methyl ester carboxylesterase
MGRFRWLVFACLALVGCIATGPEFGPPTGPEITVFLNGYRGGFLADAATGEIAYISPGQGMSSGDRSLAFHFEGQRDFPRYGELKPTGPLTKLTAVPLLIEESPYVTFLEWGKAELPGFVPFAYDWRKDLRESGAALCDFLATLGPDRRVNLVGHSMGGLVILQCLRHGPAAATQGVKKVVFLGSPFHGGPGQFDDLLLGTPSARNTALISAEALLTFPSAWQLLAPTSDLFVDEAGRPVTLNLFLAQTWIDRRWGLFAAPEVRESAAYRAQLEARIEAHRAFWAGFADEDGPAPPWKVMAVIGTGRDTTAKWRVLKDGRVDLDNPVTADGDGMVLSSSAVPPKPIHATIVNTPADHGELVKDASVRHVVREFLLQP